MFTKPDATGQRLGKACMVSFGKELVLQAVTRRAPYAGMTNYDVLRLYDKKAFESEKPPPSPPQATRFHVGDRVRLSGLTSANGRSLNGVSTLNGV